MRQLVELKRNAAEKFQEQGVEVVAVFREEKSGIDGLKKIKEKSSVEFTLGIDTPVNATVAYSPGKMKFHNYVVDKNGVVQGVIDGSLKSRAQSAQLLEIVGSLVSESSSAESPMDDKAAVERAVLDYVEGIYDVKPELIERGVHPDLKKFGYGRAKDKDEFNAGSAMTFEQLKNLASKYNSEGRIPKDAPKKVEILDVMDKIASAKLTAAWGTDMFHLVKEDGKWKILQVIWQSSPK
jgi:hypothetical protein